MTDSIIHLRSSCAICNSVEIEKALSLNSSPIAGAYISIDKINILEPSYPLDLYLCKDCGCLQLLNIISREELHGNFKYLSSSTIGLITHFNKYADDIYRYITPSIDSLVIGFGSNDGSILRFFKEKGLKVLGIEADSEVVRKSTKFGIDTIESPFNLKIAQMIKEKFGQALIIIGGSAHMVVANTVDFKSMIKSVRHILAKEGIFVFEVNYLPDIIINKSFDAIYHDHIYYFSVRSIKNAFQKNGMQLIDAMKQKLKGGCLRCIVQHEGGKRAESPSIKQLIEIEDELDLSNIITYKTFAEHLKYLKKQLVELIHQIIDEGLTVVGYGASHNVTTLIYHFQIGQFLKYLLDDNKEKHNLYSPGYHLKVMPTDIIYDLKPNYIIILAWQYADIII